jgi:hypothetical protein
MARNPTTWSNGINKAPARYTSIAKQTTAWGLETAVSAPYLYDDPTMKYDDTPVRGYDLLVPVTNTLNGKLPVAWSTVI